MFCSAGCSPLRADGISCSLCVLYGGLGISKLQFSIQKIYKKLKCWIRIRIKYVWIHNPGYLLHEVGSWHEWLRKLEAFCAPA